MTEVSADRTEELAAKAACIAADPLNFTQFNDAQRRLFDACRNLDPNSLTLVLMLKGNRAGGSYGLVGAWSAITCPTRNPLFRGAPFFGHWPYPSKSIRLVAPRASLDDEGPIQGAIKELFPLGYISQNKGSGYGYYCQGTIKGGWNFDTTTIDQHILQAAGANKGLILGSEPPPRKIFVECMTRLSGQGLLIWEMTRLDMAGFIDEYVQAGALMLDGRKVGDIRVVHADIHDSCAEHCHGHRPHSAIEAIIASWPDEERQARKTGEPLHLSGRVLPNWGAANELEVLPAYHAECWKKNRVRIASLIDPHDRLPWAPIWTATFPNEDVVVFAEWPSFDFASCKSSPVTDHEDYRSVILETEAAIGKPVVMRYMDPEHMATPGKGNSRTIAQLLAGPCRSCLVAAGAGLTDDEKSDKYRRAKLACKHRLIYQGWLSYHGSIRDGHMLLRAAIGDPLQGVRPKLYAMKAACPNFCKGMRSYAYRENTNEAKGVSETPEYVHKHYPDDIRGGYLRKIEKWPAEKPDNNTMPARPRRGPGTANPA